MKLLRTLSIRDPDALDRRNRRHAWDAWLRGAELGVVGHRAAAPGTAFQSRGLSNVV